MKKIACRIFTIDKLGVVFNQSIIPLSYTPRRFILHPPSKNFVIIESDHATFSPEAKRTGLIEKVRQVQGCTKALTLVLINISP
jgi:splicing factor 3B subunit 3